MSYVMICDGGTDVKNCQLTLLLTSLQDDQLHNWGQIWLRGLVKQSALLC